jgi:malonyl-CoA/methylmalonyl-CoA synthetase
VSLELVGRAAGHATRVALDTPEGTFTYDDLLEASAKAARRLLAGRPDLGRARVCFLVTPGWPYVVTQWGIWRAGGVAVPMAVSHPPAELAYVLDDAEPDVVVADPNLLERIEGLAAERGLTVLTPSELAEPSGPLPAVSPDRPAMMLYTSGTTGRPKGVVTTHANIQAQVESLVQAWGWREDDRILLHLPLHHVHGIVNVLTCALWSGARCEMMPRFDPVDVWERLARGHLTLYMAVPTIYRRLIEAWEGQDPDTRRRWSEGAGSCRLMVSGSAALPVPTLERWESITGQRLLERYGMTEIGMGLSNPLNGERRPGHVGRPLPGVDIRLMGDDGAVLPGTGPDGSSQAGEIQVRGPTVFGEYWRRRDATAEAFTEDGWFRTGDRAQVEAGAFRILGRSSVDILKTGGEKVSALEIEDVLRSHPAVRDCAVVGVPDEDWGDRVCAAVVLQATSDASDPPPDPQGLRAFLKERLAPYKVPKDVLLLDDLPRNAMGKVTKPAVKELFPDG